MQLLAIGVAGGNEKTDHLVLSTRATARPSRSVDMAAISPPSISDRDKAQAIHERVLGVCCPFCKVKADIHRWSPLRLMEPDEIARCLSRSLKTLLGLPESLCNLCKSQLLQCHKARLSDMGGRSCELS